jgi:hypothetical protein
VRVEPRQLQQWYRTLDHLLACKKQIEHALFMRLRDLFSLRVDMVFYDLTSTYFAFISRWSTRSQAKRCGGSSSRGPRQCRFLKLLRRGIRV